MIRLLFVVFVIAAEGVPYAGLAMAAIWAALAVIFGSHTPLADADMWRIAGLCLFEGAVLAWCSKGVSV